MLFLALPKSVRDRSHLNILLLFCSDSPCIVPASCRSASGPRKRFAAGRSQRLPDLAIMYWIPCNPNTSTTMRSPVSLPTLLTVRVTTAVMATASADFQRSKLSKAEYNDRDPQHICKFQSTVEEFTTLVRTNTMPWDKSLLDDFCAFVDDRKVWHHAQMVVPEFRNPRKQQYSP